MDGYFLQGIILLLLTIISVVIFHHFFLLKCAPNEPPLVKGLIPFLGCALEIQKDFRSLLSTYQAKYGKIFSLYVAGKRFHIISDPIDAIPIFYKNKNFDQREYADALRRKQFMNSKEEIADTDMTEQLFDNLPPNLLSTYATNQLTDRLVDSLQNTFEEVFETLGEGWKEVDLVEWCAHLVLTVSNRAILGPNFPSDDTWYHDIVQFDRNLLSAFRKPEYVLSREQELAQSLIARLESAYVGGKLDPSQLIQSRIKVYPRDSHLMAQIALDHGHEKYIPKDILVLAWASVVCI